MNKTIEEMVSRVADTVYVPFDTTMPGAIHTYGQLPGLNAIIRKALISTHTLGQEDKEREVVEIIHEYLRKAPIEIQMAKGTIFADIIKDITNKNK